MEERVGGCRSRQQHRHHFASVQRHGQFGVDQRRRTSPSTVAVRAAQSARHVHNAKDPRQEAAADHGRRKIKIAPRNRLRHTLFVRRRNRRPNEPPRQGDSRPIESNNAGHDDRCCCCSTNTATSVEQSKCVHPAIGRQQQQEQSSPQALVK